MNDDAREKFRAKYRSNVSPYYSGFIHVCMVLLGGGSIMYFSLSNIVDFQWTQLWIVAVALLAYNYGEWASHRWRGHEKTKLFKLFYQRHTGDHHTFFVEHDMEYQMVLDWRVVIFPIYLLIVFSVLVTLPGWKYLRLFHTVHHNRELMAEGNFNITLPLADWLFGTLYFSSEDKPDAKLAKSAGALN